MGSSDLPLVAIPAAHLASGRVEGWGSGAFAAGAGYVAALRRAGARPVILPGPDPEPPEDVLAPFAGLLLAGGGDLDPSHYGESPDPRVYGIDPDRDELELGLVTAALEQGMPVLAICRGAQIVNVVRGGTLYQHLPEPLGRGAHGDPTGGVLVTHGVQVAEGSRLAAAVGGHRVARCTSIHHQGIDRVGKGLVAVGWSDDGLVEAIELAGGDGWMVGVQWHPEVTAGDDPVQQSLFDAFTSEVRRSAALV
ncbi:MAG: gamma-glutamyl-gamma-aminobutyrate hydrolase family protein [Actinobacteria bacterium]|nr:gamma-glutamyl-gamma-aminobutyrate hydrolase family protein [Actinomycetota bacterium]